MSTKRGILRTGLCLLAALFGLAGFVYFYWQSLPDRSTPLRVPIPNSQLTPGDGFAVRWQIPTQIRKYRWRRTPVRLLESGKPLPFRTELSALVATNGGGRFFAKDAELWFSTIDNSKPGSNGKTYELEIGQSQQISVALAVGFLALALAALILAAPWRVWWDRLLNYCRGAQLAQRDRAVFSGAVFFLLSILALSQASPRFALWRRFEIPAGAIFQQADGSYRYYVARWIRNDPVRLLEAGLSEGNKPLVRASLAALKEGKVSGVFSNERDALVFRASEGATSSPELRSYALAIRLLSPARSIWWALVFAGIGCWLVWPRRGQQVNWAATAWRTAIIAVVLAKLWVIAGDEIIAQVSDSEDYAFSALKPIWGVNGILPGHPPGFPMLAHVAGQFGLPWRISLELMYLGICLLLASIIPKFLRWPGAEFITFCVLAWHPWTLSGFRVFMADPTVVLMVGATLGLMFRTLATGATKWSWINAVWLGGALLGWKLTREEEPLLFCFYFIFVLLAISAAKARPDWNPNLLKRAAGWLLIPLLVTGALGIAQKWLNYRRAGVYAKCLMDSPGLNSLQAALYHIQPEKVIRYAPVTYHSLQSACEASPTLKKFAPSLLDTNAWPTVMRESGTGVPGEIGPVLIWLLTTYTPGNERQRNETMLQAAREVNQALADGRLPRRAAWFPLEPKWGLWLPELPRCCWEALQLEMSLAPEGEPDIVSFKSVVSHMFDQVANRRAANICPELFLMEGKVRARAGAIDSVALRDESGRWLGACPVLASNWWDDAETFSIAFRPEKTLTNAELLFFSRGQTQHTGKVELASAGGVKQGSDVIWAARDKSESRLHFRDSNETFDYSFRAQLVEQKRAVRRAFMENFLEAEYPTMLIFALIIVFATSFLQGVWQRDHFRGLAYCFILTASCLLTRASFYSLLDANMGFHPDRYTRCVSPLYVMALVLGAALAGATLRQLASRKVTNTAGTTQARPLAATATRG